MNWTENGTVVSTTASYAFTAATNRTLVANFSTLRLGSPFLPIGYVGIPYSATFTATGGSGNYTYSLTPSIPGLSLNPNSGVLSGTPTTKGSFAFTIQVTSGGETDKTGTSVLISGVAITTASLPPATQNISYSATLSATGGNGSYSWSSMGDQLPGLTLEPNTGVLHGIPGQSGTYSLDVVVQSGGDVATKFVTLTIANGPIAIGASSPLQPATQGSSYTAVIAASGGTGNYAWELLDGTVPPGLTLAPANTSPTTYFKVAGTPTTPGTYTFTVKVTASGDGTSSAKSFSLVVNPKA